MLCLLCSAIMGAATRDEGKPVKVTVHHIYFSNVTGL
jgi:hypothetical protein